MADAQQLVVLSFDNPVRAQEFLLAAARLQQEGDILVRDAVFVSKDADGKARVQETTDISTGQSALSGALWGGLFGALLLIPIAGMAIGAGTSALAAKLTDTGIKDDFVKELRESVEAGSTALAMLVSHVNREAVLVELKRFEGAKLMQSTLSEEGIAAVKDALGEK